jgi:hypothetical protein
MGSSTATASPRAHRVERPAPTRTIMAISLARLAGMSGATSGTPVSSWACGPTARSAARRARPAFPEPSVFADNGTACTSSRSRDRSAAHTVLLDLPLEREGLGGWRKRSASDAR